MFKILSQTISLICSLSCSNSNRLFRNKTLKICKVYKVLFSNLFKIYKTLKIVLSSKVVFKIRRKIKTFVRKSSKPKLKVQILEILYKGKTNKT